MSGASRPTCGTILDLTSMESYEEQRTLVLGSRGAPHPSAADSQGGLYMRSFRYPRRSSSGYVSNESDSVPTSPLFQRPQTADKSTQTVSPSAQVIEHAVSRSAEDRSESAPRRHHGRSSRLPVNSMRDMQAVAVGRELREHGDEFNRILTQRAAGARPQRRPVVPQEPAVFVCVGFLIYFFGRLLYSHGTTYSQSQV